MFFVGGDSIRVCYKSAYCRKLVASDDVTVLVAEKARLLAENQSLLATTLQNDRVVYVGTDKIRLKTLDGMDDSIQTYQVIHYRYNDDTTINSLVNLDEGLVVEQKEIPNFPAPLAQSELDLARDLALEDKRIRSALGKDIDHVKVEALVIRAASEQDPWFGRRVVQLLFRIGRDYRHNPRVVVDLTNNIVYLDKEGVLE